MTSSRSNQDGFTLVELVLAMVVIVTLSYVMLLGYKSLHSTALNVASRQFADTVSLARQIAIYKHVPTRIEICTTPPPVFQSNAMYRAYRVQVSTNFSGSVWSDLGGWRYLPDNVAFSDLNCTLYSTTTNLLTQAPGGITAASTRTNAIPASNGVAWQYFENTVARTNTYSTQTETYTAAIIQFQPSGIGEPSSFANNKRALGVRLVNGTVDTIAKTINILNSNAWTYVEIRQIGGLARIRSSDSY